MRPVANAVIIGLTQVLPAGMASAQLSSDDIAALRSEGKAKGWTFEIGPNPATDRPLEQLCGFKKPEAWPDGARFDPCPPRLGLPDAFDWRDHGGCTPIKDQGSCGGCWAFATVAPLECNILIKDGVVVDLSEQWLISCNTETEGFDCNGGAWAHDYHQWKSGACGWCSFGAVLEAFFPYQAADVPCDNCPYPHHYLIDDWSYIGTPGVVPSVDSIKQAIMDYGPVSSFIRSDFAFQAYKGGVFNVRESRLGYYHAIVLVGWDDGEGEGGSWIVRNSWGTGWGVGGYMTVEYGTYEIGNLACYVVYAGRDDLRIEPVEVFLSEGPEGGPLIPRCNRYTLTNDGTDPIAWTAEASQPWLDVTPGSGPLGANASTMVDVCINDNANSLPIGIHTDTVAFCNTVSGDCQTRCVQLTAWEPCQPPPAPTYPDPPDGATGVPVDTDLSWNEIPPPYAEDFNDGQAQGWGEDVDADWNVVDQEYVADQPAPAVVNSMVAVYGGQEWSDCYCQVTMRRSETGYARYLLARATSDFETDPARGGSGYGFGVDEEDFLIFKLVDGTLTVLQGWTHSPHLDPPEEWNTLGVDLLGTTLAFSINGNLVWSGADSSLTEGRVGLLGYTHPEHMTTHYFDDVAVSPLEVGRVVVTGDVGFRANGTIDESDDQLFAENIFDRPSPQSAHCPVAYDAYLGTDPDNLELICEGLTDPPCAPPALLAPWTTYYWRLCASNEAGTVCSPEPDEEPWRFMTEAAPRLAGAASRKTHGDAGDLDVELPLAPPEQSGTEPRNEGPTQVVLTFTRPVEPIDGVPDATEVSLTCDDSPCGSVDAVRIVDNVMTIDLSGVPDASCPRISVAGLSGPAGDPLVGDNDVHIRALKGDVNGDGYTNLIDMTAVKSMNGADPAAPGRARYDVNTDGYINLIDMALVKSLNGGSVSCP